MSEEKDNMKHAHTKGPWRQGDGLGEIEGQFEGAWEHLANVGGVNWPSYNDKTKRYHIESKANLQLVLAAPELLEALEELLQVHLVIAAPELIEAMEEVLEIHRTAAFYQAVRTRARAIVAKVREQNEQYTPGRTR